MNKLTLGSRMKKFLSLSVTLVMLIGMMPLSVGTAYAAIDTPITTMATGANFARSEIAQAIEAGNYDIVTAPTGYGTLTYDANSGDDAPAPQSVKLNAFAAISTIQPTRNGYTFQGWSIDDSATSVQYLPGNWVLINTDTILYAVWVLNPPSSYLITYDANGGSGAPGSQTVKANTLQALSLTRPTPVSAGYTFLGWLDTVTGIRYQPGNWIYVDHNITLKAVWYSGVWTVSYDYTGAVDYVWHEPFTDGSYATNYDGLEYNGWIAEGWYKDSAYADRWNFDVDKVYGDITLYAKWDTGMWNVWYDYTEELDYIWKEQVPKGTYATDYDGHIHGDSIVTGWYKDPELTERWIFDEDVVTSDIILYAKWSKYYTVTFSDLDCLNPPAQQKVAEGAVVLRPDNPEKEGYRFTFWTYQDPSQVENGGWRIWNIDAEPVTCDMTLFANWELRSYTVTFYLDETEEVFWDEEVAHGGFVGGNPEGDPEKNAYKFVGWYLYEEGGQTYSTEWVNLPVTSDVFVIGKWVTTYNVLFYLDETLQPFWEEEVIPGGLVAGAPGGADPDKTGYAFVGWYLYKEGGEPQTYSEPWIYGPVESDILIIAKWERTAFNVSFYLDELLEEFWWEELVEKGGIVVTGHPEGDPKKPGYTFDSWYLYEDEEPQQYATQWLNDAVYTDVIVIAMWNANPVTVTYHYTDAWSGSSTDTKFAGDYADMYYYEGEQVGNLLFQYWCIDPNDPEATKYNPLQKLTIDIDLYAVWLPANPEDSVWTVYYNTGDYIWDPKVNNGELAEDLDGWFYAAKDKYAIKWYKSSDCSGEPYNFNTPVTGSFTLYPKWGYKVTFEANAVGATVMPGEILVAIGETIPEGAWPAANLEGYCLMGWLMDENDEDSLWDPDLSTVDDNITLFADWKVAHTVTFNMNGGPGEIPPLSVGDGGMIKQLDVPQWEGYEFLLWSFYDPDYLSNDGWREWVISSEPVIRDVVLWANWKPIYIVSFNLNMEGDPGNMEPISVGDGEKIVGLADPMREGYEFLLWTYYDPDRTDENGGWFVWDLVNTVVTRNTVLWANWSPK